MKRMTKTKSPFTVMPMMFALCMAATMFVSCDDDENGGSGNVLSKSAVVGSYPDGKLTVGERDTTVDVSVDGDSLRIAAFPVDQIVAAAVGEDGFEEAIASIDSVPYASVYSASVVGGSVVMDLTADSLCFDVNVGETAKHICMAFAPGAMARYEAADSTLTFSMTVEDVVVDGDTVDAFAPIDYVLSPVKKSAVENFR